MKCPSCNSEWNIGTKSSQKIIITSCPFCGYKFEQKSSDVIDETTAEGKLRRFVLDNDKGASIYASDLFYNYLTDVLVQFQKELRLCFITCKARIPKKLLDANEKSFDEKKSVVNNAIYKLKDDWGMSHESAAQVIKLLIAGLGWKSSVIEGNTEELSMAVKYIFNENGEFKNIELLDSSDVELKTFFERKLLELNNFDDSQKIQFFSSVLGLNISSELSKTSDISIEKLLKAQVNFFSQFKTEIFRNNMSEHIIRNALEILIEICKDNIDSEEGIFFFINDIFGLSISEEQLNHPEFFASELKNVITQKERFVGTSNFNLFIRHLYLETLENKWMSQMDLLEESSKEKDQSYYDVFFDKLLDSIKTSVTSRVYKKEITTDFLSTLSK